MFALRVCADVHAVNFVIVQATTVSLVYTIDSYRPVAGEVVVTQMAFKGQCSTVSCTCGCLVVLKTLLGAFGFLLFFYTNPWIAEAGYVDSTATMAAIFGAVMLFVIPLYLWGSKIRHVTLGWKVMNFVCWDEDREIGE